MNSVIFMGRLTKDPESRQHDNTTICNFTIAVDRRYKRENQPTADFFDCTAFGKTGEFIAKYFSKGARILISGEMQNNNYTDKQGKKVYGMKMIVQSVEFCESKKDNNSSGNDNFEPVDDVDDEGIPFA